MKKLYLFFMLILACFSVSAQTAKPIVQIKDMGGSLRFIHNNGTYTEIPKQSVGAILTFPNSPSVQVTVLSEGSVDRILGFSFSQVTSPITNSATQLADSISAYLNKSTSAPIPTPLIVDNIGIDTVRVLDSVRVWFEQGLDTSNQGILNGIFGILRDSLDKNVFINNDSLRVYFNQILDTSNSGVLLAIHNLLKDSLDKNVFINNDSLRVYFNDTPFVSDTANQSVLLSIHNLLKDSLDKNLYIQNDSLKVWFSQPLEVKTDTANQSVLNAILQTLVDSLDKTIYILNDSLRVWFERDTIDFEYITYCYRGKADSGVYSLSVVFSALTPYAPIFMNFLNVDSLSEIFRIDNRLGVTFGTFPNIPQDYVPCDKWEEYLTANSTKDTLKGLVYTAIAKVRTNRDTLFNCKSLSFGRKSGASGTLVLTYENGESESYDVANDDLPTWVNGEFISYIDYNATGAVGLIVNTLGCSQTSTEICAKVKPIFDCELVVPITCNGWQSASGVWQTASGCWNTGQ